MAKAGPKKTQSYTGEFKTKAVQMSLEEGVQVQEVANSLDIHPFMLSRWRKEYREGKIVPDKRKRIVSVNKEKQQLNKIQKLEKENARLKQENNLLKKWQRYLAEAKANGLDSSTDTEKN